MGTGCRLDERSNELASGWWGGWVSSLPVNENSSLVWFGSSTPMNNNERWSEWRMIKWVYEGMNEWINEEEIYCEVFVRKHSLVSIMKEPVKLWTVPLIAAAPQRTGECKGCWRAQGRCSRDWGRRRNCCRWGKRKWGDTSKNLASPCTKIHIASFWHFTFCFQHSQASVSPLAQ